VRFGAFTPHVAQAVAFMLCAKNQLKIHQIINKSSAQRNRQEGVKQ